MKISQLRERELTSDAYIVDIFDGRNYKSKDIGTGSGSGEQQEVTERIEFTNETEINIPKDMSPMPIIQVWRYDQYGSTTIATTISFNGIDFNVKLPGVPGFVILEYGVDAERVEFTTEQQVDIQKPVAEIPFIQAWKYTSTGSSLISVPISANAIQSSFNVNLPGFPGFVTLEYSNRPPIRVEFNNETQINIPNAAILMPSVQVWRYNSTGSVVISTPVSVNSDETLFNIKLPGVPGYAILKY